jgi:hypothetical protein
VRVSDAGRRIVSRGWVDLGSAYWSRRCTVGFLRVRRYEPLQRKAPSLSPWARFRVGSFWEVDSRSNRLDMELQLVELKSRRNLRRRLTKF